MEKMRGKYLYCVADSGLKLELGRIGVKETKVFTIPYRKICAVVHNINSPLESEDVELIKSWIKTHQAVIDAAWEKFGTVLPFGFGKVINGGSKDVKKWLAKDYALLLRKIEELVNKQEFGVQVLWEPRAIASKLIESNSHLASLQARAAAKSAGVAYMYKQKFDKLLEQELVKEADRCFKEIYERLKPFVEDIKVEKTRKLENSPFRKSAGGKGEVVLMQMLANFSCLVHKNRVAELGAELKAVSNTNGFSVRFTGPWPPYSFVGA